LLGTSERVISLIFIRVGTRVAIFEIVFVFTDRATFKPLINLDELIVDIG